VQSPIIRDIYAILRRFALTTSITGQFQDA